MSTLSKPRLYRVDIIREISGYTLVEASSVEEAAKLVYGGRYYGIFSEDVKNLIVESVQEFGDDE